MTWFLKGNLWFAGRNVLTEREFRRPRRETLPESMLSLDACRMALGALAESKSDDEIARMREQAMAIARIVIRTYFGAVPAASSPADATQPLNSARDSLDEQDDGTMLNGREGRRRPRRVRRRPVQVANSRGDRRPRGEKTTQS